MPLLLAACLAAPTASAKTPPPVPGGRIGTLTLGRYTCEMPGDANGPAGKPATEYDFSIINSSSYKAGGTRGSYLYTGNRVVMTSGKHKGMTFRRVSSGFLRQTGPDGADGNLRCVLSSRKL